MAMSMIPFWLGLIGNRYTLQRINHDVFKDPVSLMDNFARVTAHLAKKHTDGRPL